MMLPIDDLQADVLILGAGMLAALHVTTANPTARIVIAVKGVIGIRFAFVRSHSSQVWQVLREVGGGPGRSYQVASRWHGRYS